MFTNSNCGRLAEVLDLLAAEIRYVRSRRFVFRVVHRWHITGTACVPGEEVLAIFLVFREHEYQLRLSPTLLLIADYLLRTARYAQTASQISSGIGANGFYVEHGKYGGRKRPSRVPRSAVKEYIRRLQKAIGIALTEANLCFDPKEILVVEDSVSNHVLYRWMASIDLVHLDLSQLPNATEDSKDPVLSSRT